MEPDFLATDCREGGLSPDVAGNNYFTGTIWETTWLADGGPPDPACTWKLRLVCTRTGQGLVWGWFCRGDFPDLVRPIRYVGPSLWKRVFGPLIAGSICRYSTGGDHQEPGCCRILQVSVRIAIFDLPRHHRRGCVRCPVCHRSKRAVLRAL